ncbi:Rab geranylgeranyltransferase [Marasmius crinis-equi]|uniref:Geranylgeranyl transferase type-2 subunit alpha n=1 Tax=Marasmius crinis-equi TaxID=585013 RepID=A0ABR3FXJ3_9AGAR
MHGIKRVPLTEEALQAKRKREETQIAAYNKLTDDVLARKKKKDHSKEAFDLTTALLRENAEFYTVWNYRRHILLHGIFPSSTPAEMNDLLTEDLSMTTAALKRHPKVYWIWNHRRWCLENVPDGPGTAEEGDIAGWRKTYWNKELYVVERMLEADPRNFHAWNYRRYVLANMPNPKPETAELAYTTKKIESSLTNFSAWHQRSKVLSSLWEKGALDPATSKEEEFDLVKNAIFTEPSDQSAWIYHRWLVGFGADKELLEREISVIQELLDEQPDSKWCLESLVHYKRLLMQEDPNADNQVLTKDCLRLLEELRTVDPERKQRYHDIALTARRCIELELQHS